MTLLICSVCYRHKSPEGGQRDTTAGAPFPWVCAKCWWRYPYFRGPEVDREGE